MLHDIERGADVVHLSGLNHDVVKTFRRRDRRNGKRVMPWIAVHKRQTQLSALGAEQHVVGQIKAQPVHEKLKRARFVANREHNMAEPHITRHKTTMIP